MDRKPPFPTGPSSTPTDRPNPTAALKDSPDPQSNQSTAEVSVEHRHSEQPEGREAPIQGTIGGPQPRRKRTAVERRYAGYSDGIERSFCAAATTTTSHQPPPEFPAHARSGVATLRVVIVAERPTALLLCDTFHPGPHRWPDGVHVVAPTIAAPLADDRTGDSDPGED